MLKNEDVENDDTQSAPAVNQSVNIQPMKEEKNITDEPQSEEHLNMKLLGNSLPLRKIYLDISDDKGEFFGNMPLEKIMTDFLGQLKTSAKNLSAEAIKKLLSELINVSKAYNRQINLATSIASGILVKHQIRLGSMFLYQKKLIRKIDPEKNWIEWFSETYGSSSLRSAQDFMRLADTPNIIRYAVFGKERLIEILRATPSFASSDDPIGAFLAKYKFSFDPEKENFMDDWRSNIDTAIAMEKIRQIEKKEDVELGLNFDQVKKLIDGNVPVTSKIISDLVIIKEANGNPAEYIETSVLGKGSKNIQIERVEKQESVQRISRMLKDLVDFYSKETEAIAEINATIVNELKLSVEALINLINK
ncbi:MAG: hypothetical protein ABSC11_13115 [Smithella sp.]|jgi:hypothetical protein